MVFNIENNNKKLIFHGDHGDPEYWSNENSALALHKYITFLK